jgi:hypothetical protein
MGYIENLIPLRNYWRVWWCKAKHCSNPTTRQIRLDEESLRLGGGESSE